MQKAEILKIFKKYLNFLFISLLFVSTDTISSEVYEFEENHHVTTILETIHSILSN